jgi:3-hydroxybutyryl-CoA dehydrogenase
MSLVEIVMSATTSDETYKLIEDATFKIGKVPVKVNDSPGFIANRLLMPMINEAAFLVYEGVAMPKDVDDVVKGGLNHPVGPLALADLIGLDTCLSIMEALCEGFNDPKYSPCPLLRQYVDAGWLGKKTKKGFFTYE